MGPGGMGQSGGHGQSNLNDNVAPGLPPTSMMQSQMSNGNIYFIYFAHKPRLCAHIQLHLVLLSPVLGVCMLQTLLHVYLQIQCLVSVTLLPESICSFMFS